MPGYRFAFGRNWRRFLDAIDDERIDAAKSSLVAAFGADDLRDKSFLDVGCGSGLFSLAARRLGASVFAFDLDCDSVACAKELKRRFLPDDRDWRIELGSVLDTAFLSSLGTFDVVYAWGVLHHTGEIWRAIGNVSHLVKPSGKFYLAIYNDQGRRSIWWRHVKLVYHRLPRMARPTLVALIGICVYGQPLIASLLDGAILLCALKNPSIPLIHYYRETFAASPTRGMHAWRDLVDWVGGYPFEVAQPDAVFHFFRDRGFALAHLRTVGCGHGCNEFVFVRTGEGKSSIV